LTRIGYHNRLDRVLHRMRKDVAGMTPWDTGATAMGWETKSFGGGMKGRSGYLGVVRNRLAQGRGKRAEFYKMLLNVLEYGSTPHPIPLQAKTDADDPAFLYFEDDNGRLIRKRQVQHPGTKAYGMVRKTAAYGNTYLSKALKEIQQLYAREFGGK
jgi:hypothetical protein